jgi:hypothetical protein
MIGNIQIFPELFGQYILNQPNPSANLTLVFPLSGGQPDVVALIPSSPQPDRTARPHCLVPTPARSIADGGN